MADVGRGHEPERHARDQLVARIVWLLLAPVEEVPDGHAGSALCRGRGHRLILRQRR